MMADKSEWDGTERRGGGATCVMHLECIGGIERRLDDGVGQFRDLRAAQAEMLTLVRRIDEAIRGPLGGKDAGMSEQLRQMDARVTILEADRKAAMGLAFKIFCWLAGGLVASGSLVYGILHAAGKP